MLVQTSRETLFNVLQVYTGECAVKHLSTVDLTQSEKFTREYSLSFWCACCHDIVVAPFTLKASRYLPKIRIRNDLVSQLQNSSLCTVALCVFYFRFYPAAILQQPSHHLEVVLA